MEEETGEIKVKMETATVFLHLALRGQFFGFCGSSGPSHVTKSGSNCLVGSSDLDLAASRSCAFDCWVVIMINMMLELRIRDSPIDSPDQSRQNDDRFILSVEGDY